MSTIQVQIPDSLQKSLDDLAARDEKGPKREVEKSIRQS